MEHAIEGAPTLRPLWRRIIDFPLVTLVIATALFAIGIIVAAPIAQFALAPVKGMATVVKFDLVAGPILVLIYLLAIRRLGAKPRNDLRLDGAMRDLGLGLAAGFLVFSVAVAIAAVLGVYKVVGWGDFSNLMPALIASAIFPAISEEMLFRGIFFRWIEEFGGSWLALAVTSALFGAAHLMNPNANMVGAIGIAFEAGVMLGAAYMLTRSLWLPMGIHAAWNFAQGEIYDIPVSGTKVHGILDATLEGPPLLTGAGFGLEASIIAIAVATLFGTWLLWTAIRKGELVSPIWVSNRRLPAR